MSVEGIEGKRRDVHYKELMRRASDHKKFDFVIALCFFVITFCRICREYCLWEHCVKVAERADCANENSRIVAVETGMKPTMDGGIAGQQFEALSLI